METSTPKWCHVFKADLKIRVSRFRFLGKFRYALPFLPLVLFLVQFAIVFIYPINTNSFLSVELASLLKEAIFQINAVFIGVVILISFNSSLNYFASYTEPAELEIISSSPISTRSYLVGKYITSMINNFILIPVIMLGQLELARLAGLTLHWLYFLIYLIAITILVFSLSWIAITIAPRAVHRLKSTNNNQRQNNRIIPLWVGLLVLIQFVAPFICGTFLSKELFRKIFIFIPHGWFAETATYMFEAETIQLSPILFGLGAIIFSLIFVVISFFTTNFNLNLEDYEKITHKTKTDVSLPRLLPLFEKIPLPYKYSAKAFYLDNYRKRSFDWIMDIFYFLAFVGIIVARFVFPYYNWSLIFIYAAFFFSIFKNSVAAMDGMQLLFGAKNTFLLAQSAPNGIRKMLAGKFIQSLLSNLKTIIPAGIIVIVFVDNKLLATLFAFVFLAATFNGLAVGLFGLSIAPFFETSDITSNPIRGFQLMIPLNVNITLGAGVLGVAIPFLWETVAWLVPLIALVYLIIGGIIAFLFAEKLLKRFET